MNQYTMIEKALSEHKRLSTITGAQALSISMRELTFSYFRKDGSLIDSLRGC